MNTARFPTLDQKPSQHTSESTESIAGEPSPSRLTVLGPRPWSVATVMTLQQTIGNRATHRLLSRQVDPRASVGTPPLDAQTSSDVSEASQGAGISVDGGVRRRVERTTGADLSEVRVHTGKTSQRAARSLRARAYTMGQDIHFAAGQYQPGTPDGNKLIAHELVHTVQQRDGASQPLTKLEVSQPGDAAESEADAIADKSMSDAPDVTATRPARLSVMRMQRMIQRSPNDVLDLLRENSKAVKHEDLPNALYEQMLKLSGVETNALIKACTANELMQLCKLLRLTGDNGSAYVGMICRKMLAGDNEAHMDAAIILLESSPERFVQTFLYQLPRDILVGPKASKLRSFAENCFSPDELTKFAWNAVLKEHQKEALTTGSEWARFLSTENRKKLCDKTIRDTDDQEMAKRCVEVRFQMSLDGAAAFEIDALKRIYETMSALPEGHVQNVKLMNRDNFDVPREDVKGEYNFRKRAIEVAYPDLIFAKPKAAQGGYFSMFSSSNDAKNEPSKAINALRDRFAHVVRHEVGHSIDEYLNLGRNKQKNKHAPERCPMIDAIWKEYQPDQVKPLAEEVIETSGNAIQGLKPPEKKTVVQKAFQRFMATAKRPGTVEKFLETCLKEASEEDLKLDELDIPAILKDEAAQVLTRGVAAKHPWNHVETVIPVNGRGVHEAQNGIWVSYDIKARTREVSQYQFRAPGEWFAEGYAYYFMDRGKTLFKKDPELCKWIYQNLDTELDNGLVPVKKNQAQGNQIQSL